MRASTVYHTYGDYIKEVDVGITLMRVENYVDLQIICEEITWET